MRMTSKTVTSVAALLGACATVASAPASAQTFPYDVNYPYGLASQGIAPDQTAADAQTQSDWAIWKQRWVSSSGAGDYGLRVLFDADPDTGSSPGNTSDRTVSEGMGYAMLLSVYLDDQNSFDRFYTYVQEHEQSDGLMSFKIDPSGQPTDNPNITLYGYTSATDGDEDIAVALVFADAKWGTNNTGKTYLADAKNMINAIMTHDIDSVGGLNGAGSAPTYIVVGGDTQQISPINFNPSYFAPAWYRIFQNVTQDGRWQNVIDAGYALEQTCANSTTGLAPENCESNGQADPDLGPSGHNYSYNAFRTPIREAIDHSWNGETRGSVQQIGNYYAGLYSASGIPTDPYAASPCNSSNPLFTNDNPGILATRELDGTVDGDFEESEFLAAAASAQLTRNDTYAAQELYDALAGDNNAASYANGCTKDLSYFELVWKIFGEMYITGNFPNLYTGHVAP